MTCGSFVICSARVGCTVCGGCERQPPAPILLQLGRRLDVCNASIVTLREGRDMERQQNRRGLL